MHAVRSGVMIGVECIRVEDLPLCSSSVSLLGLQEFVTSWWFVDEAQSVVFEEIKVVSKGLH